MVARVVDNTSDPLTRPLTVTAAAPLTATPATSSPDVPAPGFGPERAVDGDIACQGC